MRLGGIAKAGFYPTPPRLVTEIAKKLSTHGAVALLDPCCGEGEALRTLRLAVGGKSWGIELDETRAQQAKRGNTHVRHADALECEAEGFSLLYLNPPYDNNDGERLERTFLRRYYPSLVRGGLLMLIIPERVLDGCSVILNRRFTEVRAYRFPASEYAAYGQVLVTGYRNDVYTRSLDIPILNWEALPELYLCRAESPHVQRTGIGNEQMFNEARHSRLWNDLWHATEPASVEVKPLMPLEAGHVALLVATGRLNGVIVEDAGQRLLVRGAIEKRMKVRLEGMNVIETERFVGVLQALDLTNGEIFEIE